jgi:hypothetical protein
VTTHIQARLVGGPSQMKKSKRDSIAFSHGLESAVFELDTNTVCIDNPYDYRTQRIAHNSWWNGFNVGWTEYPMMYSILKNRTQNGY